MTWLTEDPTAIVVVAAIAEVILLVALVITRLAKVLVAMGVVAALAALLVTVEWMIETDREKVHATLGRLVANVKSGRVEAVNRDISSRPEGLALQALVRRYLPQTDVDRIIILELAIAVDAPPPPNLPEPISDGQSVPAMNRWARAELRAVVTGTRRAGLSGKAPVDATLIFAPEEDRWVLVTFENYEGAGQDLLRAVPP